MLKGERHGITEFMARSHKQTQAESYGQILAAEYLRSALEQEGVMLGLVAYFSRESRAHLLNSTSARTLHEAHAHLATSQAAQALPDMLGAFVAWVDAQENAYFESLQPREFEEMEV